MLGIKNVPELFLELKDRLNVKGWEPKEFFDYGLLWARQGCSFQELGFYISCLGSVSCLTNLLDKDRTTAARRMEQWIDCVYPCALNQIQLQSLPLWILHTPEELREQFPNCLFFFVDGTILKMWTPDEAKLRRAAYNNKHGCFSWSFFIVVDAVGHIVYLSNLELGARHDATAWNMSTVVSELENFYEASEPWVFCIGGDKAYPNIDLPDNWEVSYVKS